MSLKQSTKSSKLWRMNKKYLLDSEFLNYIKNHIHLFIQTNVHKVDPQDRPEIGIIWDVFKAYIRGIMLFAVKRKAALKKEINKLKKHKYPGRKHNK